MMIRSFLCLISSTLAFGAAQYKTQPNVIFFLGDDIGWNDVGWHNKKFMTPNLDKLAKEGVILDQYYTYPLCTPSRVSLMTGYYAQSVGLQRGVLQNQESAGLPLRYKLLPQKLKEAGYSTHAFGKWHVGYCNESYTPTARGFDTFLGFYTGAGENYLHCAGDSFAIIKETCLGLDFYENGKLAPKYTGQFSNDVYTNRALKIIKEQNKGEKPFFMYFSMTNMHFPVQAPKMFYKRCSNIKNTARRTFCAAMAAYDDSVKKIVDSLKISRLYDNTVIIFASDNGAWSMYGGSNYPLRGEKTTLWEGGCRVPAFIHSPLLKKSSYVQKGLFHVSDWYPTIIGLANAIKEPNLDGVNQWSAISQKKESQRHEVVYNVDYKEGHIIGAIRIGSHKLTSGPPGLRADVIPESETTDYSLDKAASDTFKKDYFTRPFNKSDVFIRLFNLKDDPYEEHNLASVMPEQANRLLKRLKAHAKKAKSPWKGTLVDPAGDPTTRGGVYAPGWCEARYDVPTARLIV